MRFTDLRLKVIHFIRKYRNLLLILFIIWFSIFIINYYIGHRVVKPEATSTYEAHTSVINSSSTVPSGMQTTIEEIIDEYMGYCNEGNYQKAFNMLSKDCQTNEYNNNVERFMDHVLQKMPTPKKYAIQDYSNVNVGGKTLYIYEIKYTDDLLATGLTNTTYSFTSEKISFYDSDDGIQMNVGDYICRDEIKSISENEYLKIDVMNRVVNYSSEIYEIKFTNRSNYTIVIADGAELDEIVLTLSGETRNRGGLDDIVLAPQEELTLKFEFPKFVDDGDTTKNLLFSSIRVMEKYSGTVEDNDITEDVVKSEIDNAIAKFSMTVGL